jgi:GR25 family glycosyltransferase involved in LPS biosynthesis
MNDLNYYWINLDKAKDRRIFMENQFEKIGVVNNHRISAYTPDDLSSILIDNPPYNCGYPECIQNGCKNCPIEFAVLCSHMKAIQEGYKSNAPYFIVCEDDIGLVLFLMK